MKKLEQAIRQMNPGNKFTAENIIMDEEGVLRFPTGVFVSMCQSNLDLEGEIIRAEPEVLSRGQLHFDYCNEKCVKHLTLSDFDSGLIDKADKNGQIKEWKRLKPLIDEVQNFFDISHSSYFSESRRVIVEQLKNLTPPWEAE